MITLGFTLFVLLSLMDVNSFHYPGALHIFNSYQPINNKCLKLNMIGGRKLNPLVQFSPLKLIMDTIKPLRVESSNPYLQIEFNNELNSIFYVNDSITLMEMKKLITVYSQNYSSLFRDQLLRQSKNNLNDENESDVLVHSIVGIDCEWQPEYFAMRSESNKKSSILWTNTTISSLFSKYSAAKTINQMIVHRLKLSDSWEVGLLKLYTYFKQGMSTLINVASKVNTPKNINGAVVQKPKGYSSPVSLLQISTRNKVFIVDLQVLCQQVPPYERLKDANSYSLTDQEKLLNEIFNEIFNNPYIIKVGMGTAQDLKRLSWSYPWLCSLHSYVTVLDLPVLAKKAFPELSTQKMDGLSKLSELLLNSRIDKSFQCINWAYRPIHDHHINYCATDAFILTIMFDLIVQKLKYRRSSLTESNRPKKKKNNRNMIIEENDEHSGVAEEVNFIMSAIENCCNGYEIKIPVQNKPTNDTNYYNEILENNNNNNLLNVADDNLLLLKQNSLRSMGMNQKRMTLIWSEVGGRFQENII
eukprot:gene6449-8871_t